MGYPSFIGADDERPAERHWQQMPTELKKELQHYIASYHAPTGKLDGPCFWYDEKLRVCKHHEHRPNVCRDFRVGGQVCRQWRDHYAKKLN
jgi:Fe-S-cluster containining protein